MAKFCENEFEQAVLEKFENNSWEYLCGYDISRELDSPILKQDLRTYLDQNYDSLSDNEFDQVASYITEYSNQSLYRALKETYKRLFKGFDLLRDDGSRLFINFFDFGDDAETNNIFRVVNQFEFQEYKLQRPDIVLFINGIPVMGLTIGGDVVDGIPTYEGATRFDSSTRSYVEVDSDTMTGNSGNGHARITPIGENYGF